MREEVWVITPEGHKYFKSVLRRMLAEDPEKFYALREALCPERSVADILGEDPAPKQGPYR